MEKSGDPNRRVSHHTKWLREYFRFMRNYIHEQPLGVQLGESLKMQLGLQRQDTNSAES